MATVTPSNDISYFQPIIRGIQNVGSAQILYRYNYKSGSNYYLPIPSNFAVGPKGQTSINCQEDGIPVAGFRLDSEFLRANPQIASAFTIPVLGGGGVSLTNNNRTGTLNLACTRVAAPNIFSTEHVAEMVSEGSNNMSGIGVTKDKDGNAQHYWDFVTLAQLQQGQDGGDSYGAQITIKFGFCGTTVTVTFEGCTIATVDPLGMSGNDAVNYGVAVNYLNWKLQYSAIDSKTGKLEGAYWGGGKSNL